MHCSPVGHDRHAAGHGSAGLEHRVSHPVERLQSRGPVTLVMQVPNQHHGQFAPGVIGTFGNRQPARGSCRASPSWIRSLTQMSSAPISSHMSEMRIAVAEFAGGTGVLGGATAGRRHLECFLGRLAIEPAVPTIAFLDFSGVEVVTASWVREAILGARDRLRGRHSKWYPVVCDLAEDVEEEFLIVLKQRADVVLACRVESEGEIRDAAPLGVLDEKQRMTFELVNERIETDAGELMRAYGESEGTRHQTAWNNRLAGLAAYGLVAELSRGRSKRYRTLLGSTAGKGAS